MFEVVLVKELAGAVQSSNGAAVAHARLEFPLGRCRRLLCIGICTKSTLSCTLELPVIGAGLVMQVLPGASGA